MHGDKPARRAVLATVGTLCSGALAGCSGSDSTGTESDGNGDTADNQDSDSGDSTDEQSEETDTQQSAEYPSEEPQSDVEEHILRVYNNTTDPFAIKINDLNYINNKNINSPDGEHQDHKETLYKSLNSDVDGGINSLWFCFERDGTNTIFIFVNPETEEISYNSFYSEQEIKNKEYPEKGEFIRERLDGDGIVNHAGEIPEYAREALESGWQAQ
jgi:hypothetical protein